MLVRRVLRDLERDVIRPQHALTVRPHREDRAFAEARADVDQAVADHRRSARRMPVRMLQPPDFLPALRFVSVRRARADADHRWLAVDRRDPAGRKRLAIIALPLGLAVRAQVAVIHQRDDELPVAAVIVLDQQILVDQRRRSRPTKMVHSDVAPLPDRLGGRGVQAGGAGGAKGNVNASLLNHRRRRCVAVVVLENRIGRGIFKQPLILNNLPRLLVDADREQVAPILRRAGHPNLLAPNHRRRP